MRFYITILLFSVLAVGAAACGGPDTPTPRPTVPTPTARATAVAPTATLFVVNPGGVRRAPGIAPTPTDIPTQQPTLALTDIPTAAPTELPSATATPADTSTPVPVSTVVVPATNTRLPATVAPTIAPGVYVTALRVDPPEPKTKPAEFFFTVNFLNTVGETVNYPLWRVLIFPQGQNKSIGDPQGVSKTIAVETSQQTTVPTSINVTSSCEAFVAQPVWQDEEGRQTPLNKPDGSSITLEFQVCPS